MNEYVFVSYLLFAGMILVLCGLANIVNEVKKERTRFVDRLDYYTFRRGWYSLDTDKAYE